MRALAVAIAALVLVPASTAGSVFVIDGRGWGHGVGMSQWGAEGYARHGWTYRRILGHYYPHTRIQVVRRGAVRVLLLEKQPSVRISSPKPFRVVGKRRIVRRVPLTLRSGLGRAVRIEPGAQPLLVNGTAYRGALVVKQRQGGLLVVNVVPLDLYIRGVVPYEMPKGWSAESYDAQTVVARSYALARLESRPDFDLYADQRSQVYGGVEAERPATNRAVGATAGRVLTYHGRVITAYYHSSSGGWTADAATVWNEPLPYLVSVRDPYDGISPYHHWGPYVFTLAGLRKKLHAPRLRDAISLVDRTGRARSVRLVGAASSRVLGADAFRRRLGLRSTTFSLRVLSLEPAVRTTLGAGVTVSGFARGLGALRLERRTPTGAWRGVRRVHAARDGRFRVVVRSRGRDVYRVVAPRYGAAVEVRLPGSG